MSGHVDGSGGFRVEDGDSILYVLSSILNRPARIMSVPSRIAALFALLLAGCGGGPEPDPKARDAAEWAIRRGGTVRIIDSPGVVRDLGRLPGGEFALEEIDMSDLPPGQPAVEDAELKAIEGLTNLRRLVLYGSNVTDKGCASIATISSLRELELSQTQVSDRGLDELGKLPEIEKVFLRNIGPSVTDDAVKAFERKTGAQVFR